jgi:hypothetical protein
VTHKRPFVSLKTVVWSSKGLAFKSDAVSPFISLLVPVKTSVRLCNLLSCLPRSGNWWHSRPIFLLSLSFSIILGVCVCVFTSDHQFLSSVVIYSLTVFFLVSSAYRLFPVRSSGFLFRLRPWMWRLRWIVFVTGLCTTFHRDIGLGGN